MKILTCSFIDSYGMEHTAAQCFVHDATKSETTNESLFFDQDSATLKSDSSGYNSVTYSIGFWHNEAVMQRKARTLLMFNPETMDTSTTFTLDESDADMTLEDAVIKHFKTHFATAASCEVISEREVTSATDKVKAK